MFDYEAPSSLENMLFKQLTTVIDRMNVTPTVNVAELKRATMSAAAAPTDHGVPEIKDRKKDSNEDNAILYDYTEKSFVVAGNTLAYKDKFKDWGGRWMKSRGGQWVWMFAKKSNLDRVSKLLKQKKTLAPYPVPPAA